ncbi:MAG: DUF58 domain-containing protein [Ethanoligenens sp.]
MVKRIIISAIIFILLAVPAVFLRNPFGYLPALFLLVLVGLSFLYIWLLKRSFTFLQASDNKQCERGVEQHFAATVAGRGLLMFPRITCCFYTDNLLGQITQTAHVDTTLSPQEKRTFSFGIKFDHLGTYEVGISSARIYDLFGMFYLNHPNSGQSHVTVRPRALQVACFDFAEVIGHQSNMATSKSKMETDDYSGIRQYVPGDAIKNIHWKISAHSSEYMVRMFESYTSRGYTVYLDLEATGYTPEVLFSLYDCLVETAYSVACHVLRENEDLELVYMKDDEVRLALPRSRENIDHTVADFGDIAISNNGHLITALEANAGRQYGLDILVLCTANLSEPLVQISTAAVGLHKAIFLFYVVPAAKKGHLTAEEQGLLDAFLSMGAEICVLAKADEIQETGAEAYA